MPLPSGHIAPALLAKDYPFTGRFVAVANAANGIVYSDDGINWSQGVHSFPVANRVEQHPNAGFLVGWVNGTDCQESTDGINWSLNPDGTGRVCRALLWVDDLNLWIYGSESTDPVFTSPAGIPVSWTQRTCPTATFRDLAYSPTLGIIVGPTISPDGYLTSPDGINWTARSGTLTDVVATVWSPELGIFCSISSGGNCETSTDGINWTNQGIVGNTLLRDIEWSPELGLFVVVGQSMNGVATSPDGENWTVGTLAQFDWLKVVWSPDIGLFLASNTNNGATPFATSPDGINWTVRAATGVTNKSWTDIVAGRVPPA